MNNSVLRSLLFSLPALAVIGLWVLSTLRPKLFSSSAMEPVYWTLIALSLLSLCAAIWHFIVTPKASHAVLCLVANIIGLLSNIYGFGLVMKATLGRLL